MRTTLDLDEDLLRHTLRESGKKSKKAALEEAMREYVNARRRERFLDRIGKWEIDLTHEDLRKLRGVE